MLQYPMYLCVVAVCLVQYGFGGRFLIENQYPSNSNEIHVGVNGGNDEVHEGFLNEEGFFEVYTGTNGGIEIPVWNGVHEKDFFEEDVQNNEGLPHQHEEADHNEEEHHNHEGLPDEHNKVEDSLQEHHHGEDLHSHNDSLQEHHDGEDLHSHNDNEQEHYHGKDLHSHNDNEQEHYHDEDLHSHNDSVQEHYHVEGLQEHMHYLDFSEIAGNYLLNYTGPGVINALGLPWQEEMFEISQKGEIFRYCLQSDGTQMLGFSLCDIGYLVKHEYIDDPRCPKCDNCPCFMARFRDECEVEFLSKKPESDCISTNIFKVEIFFTSSGCPI